MEIVPDCFIERMEFEPDLREGKWSARIRVYVRNLSALSKSVNVRLSCAGCDGAVQGTAFANQITEMALSMEFYAAQAWSHESPSLYYLKAALWVDDERADDLIAVSYTHLDVYKRQRIPRTARRVQEPWIFRVPKDSIKV